jgi:hypothetical protein
MTRIPYGDLPGEVKACLANLALAVKRRMPEVSSFQATLEPVGAEAPPTFDVRTLP